MLYSDLKDITYSILFYSALYWGKITKLLRRANRVLSVMGCIIKNLEEASLCRVLWKLLVCTVSKGGWGWDGGNGKGWDRRRWIVEIVFFAGEEFDPCRLVSGPQPINSQSQLRIFTQGLSVLSITEEKP